MINGRELRSTVTEDGRLRLSIEEVTIGDPGDDEIIVRVEAAPINPTDIALLLGPADVSSAATAAASRPEITFQIPQARLGTVEGRVGLSLAVGLEGAGTVIAAGRNARALEGRVVAMMSGGMFTEYRKVSARDVFELPAGLSAAEGASVVNPLTALGMLETARLEGHSAIIHTAAASNLGQMMQKICSADDVPLINIVRSQEQATLLQDIGARYVLDSTDRRFDDNLIDAIFDTGATIAFDAIGGGTMGNQLLQAMERAAVRKMSGYVRTGSDVFKQLYIYGALDLSPTVLNRPAFGYRWGATGWIVFSFLSESSREVVDRLSQRMLNELTTTFASNYTRIVSLAEALQPNILQAYQRKATGEKYLIDPSRG